MASSSIRSFGKICDDEIEILLLTEENLEKAINVLHKSFFLNESVSRATDICLPESQESREELSDLCREAAKDGVSIIAKHIPSNTVVSVAFNKIQHSDDQFFIQFTKRRCRTPNSKCLLDYMTAMDNKVDLFKHFETQCLFEILFLSTLPDYEKKHIARNLCKYSIQLAEELHNGIGVERIKDQLKGRRPAAICATFTSTFSQKVGDATGFKVLATVPYSEFSFNNRRFDEVIGPIHPFGVLSAKRL